VGAGHPAFHSTVDLVVVEVEEALDVREADFLDDVYISNRQLGYFVVKRR
jgi:hypothetical protein